MVSVKFIIHIYFLVQNMWISRENLWQLYDKDPEMKIILTVILLKIKLKALNQWKKWLLAY